MPDENNKQPNTESENSLAKCQRERDEYLAGWQRAKADLLNYKKEEAARLEEFTKYHNADFILELISVLDNFDLALTVMEKNKTAAGPGGGEVETPTPQAVRMEKGIYMIRTQLTDILKKRGLAPIEVKRGDRFDPTVMEAIAEMDSDLPEGSVVEKIETGYRLHDRTLRPARVKVSKGQTNK